MSRTRATCMLAAALLFCAAAFDSPSLYVPGIGLLLLTGVALAWVELARRGVVVERLPGAWSVVEGQPFRLRTAVEFGRVNPPRARIVDPLLERALTIEAESGIIEAEARFERRGTRQLPKVTLEVGDQFGLHIASSASEDGPTVLVLPRIEEVSAPRPGGQHSHRGGFGSGAGEESGLDAEAVDFELDGLRPYRAGTPASRIHWRSVARGGELLEHRMVSGGGSDPVVVFDSHSPDGSEALDVAVRAAASLCRALAEAGGCNLLLPGEARPLRVDPGLRSWPDVHARLALVERSRRPPAVSRPGATVYWVSASKRAREHAAAAGITFGFLVTPGDAGPDDAFAVSGCHGRALAAPQQRKPVTRAA
jgi:uncharacterized protein (DUF58 family)